MESRLAFQTFSHEVYVLKHELTLSVENHCRGGMNLAGSPLRRTSFATEQRPSGPPAWQGNRTSSAPTVLREVAPIFAGSRNRTGQRHSIFFFDVWVHHLYS